MEKNPLNDQIDRISLLPDEILHCIIGLRETSKQAAQTSALSRRWRSLWQTYPVVEFDYENCSPQNYPGNLENLVAASIRRFSRDGLLRMEKLKLSLVEENTTLDSSVVEQLLVLASDRKAEDISINLQGMYRHTLCLPLESLSNSSVKSLRLSKLALVCNKDPGDLPSLSLNFLRLLRLRSVDISDDRVITNLIASSPLLETLELECILKLVKIRVSDAVNLRTLKIDSCCSRGKIEIVVPRLETLNLCWTRTCDLSSLSLNFLRFLQLSSVEISDGSVITNLIASSPLLETIELELIQDLEKIRVSNVVHLRTLTIYRGNHLEGIEIIAPGLQTLNLYDVYEVLRIDLNAPQLSHLKITPHECSTFDNNYRLVQMISELRLLKFVGIPGFQPDKKLKFSSPKLEKFEVWPMAGLEEIELDGGPDLSNFILHWNCYAAIARRLKKCEIRNAAADCLWEFDYSTPYLGSSWAYPCYLELKRFLSKFSHQFHTVNFSCCLAPAIFDEVEVDQTLHPIAIRHLKINTICSTRFSDQDALLDSLFWICHPRYITFLYRDYERKLLQVFLSRYMEKSFMTESRKEPSKGRYNWEHQLKDVKIVGRDVDKAFRKGEEVESASTIVSEDAAIALFEAQRQVCFELTWY